MCVFFSVYLMGVLDGVEEMQWWHNDFISSTLSI